MITSLRSLAGTTKRATIGIAHNYSEQLSPINAFIRREVIGSSYDNHDITCYTIGSGDTNILFLGGIHGNEVGTVKLMHTMIHWLDEKKDGFRSLQFHVIPYLNPDGYKEALLHPNYFGGGRIGRCNGNGVDLNRNFPTPSFQSDANWNYGKEYQEKKPLSAGTHGGSEPETVALMNFIESQNISLLYAYHNVGNDVMGNHYAFAQDLAECYAKSTGITLLDANHSELLGQTGTLCQWCDMQDIACLEIETPYRWGSNWNAQKKGIQETLHVMNDKNQ